MKKLSQVILMLVALGISATGLAREAAEAQGEGEIQDLSFGTNEATIAGRGYHVSPTAKVEIGGTYGAFTMLTEGMTVRFIYMHYPDGRREIIEMYEDIVEEF